MSLLPSDTNKSLQSIAAFCFLVLANVLICFSTAGVVMLQLLAAGTNKYLALVIAILVAAACNAYITFSHKIREFIARRQ
jgi:putative flippase GtrA